MTPSRPFRVRWLALACAVACLPLGHLALAQPTRADGSDAAQRPSGRDLARRPDERRRDSGREIRLFGQDFTRLTEEQRFAMDQRIGVMFQHGALFSSLTVIDNIKVPLREYLDLPESLMEELARVKLGLVGLPQDAAGKLPSELSGGMIKRAALARALALDPELVFLDEPTSGLDPIGAAEFDDLIQTLQRTLGLTVFMVTHDLDSIYAICDRIAALAEGKVIAEGTIQTMLSSQHPWVKAYFRGKRGRVLALTRDDRHAPAGGL